MKQYLELLNSIKENGVYKKPARENMPGTTSLFGHQFRHNLQEGFPLLTTKKMFWKGVVIELLWFLRGDTNIKYLIDNGVNIWDEDAYNYYVKICRKNNVDPCSYEGFITSIEMNDLYNWKGMPSDYTLGDCGFQYGKVWRSFGNQEMGVDQIDKLIKSLKNTPESRRHILTAIDPCNEENLALYWCHALVQFNCRPIDPLERARWAVDNNKMHRNEIMFDIIENPERTLEEQLDENNIPKYYLDCQLYQRSADVFLGVPFNIASYALLTEILSKICNMVPGEFIHTFGDVHIYDNHKDSIETQLSREPKRLPRLIINKDLENLNSFDDLALKDFEIINYNPHPSIKGELSTGLKK